MYMWYGFRSLKSEQLIYPILGSSRNELTLHVAVVYFVALINCPFLVGSCCVLRVNL